jgi:hypothetical protein
VLDRWLVDVNAGNAVELLARPLFAAVLNSKGWGSAGRLLTAEFLQRLAYVLITPAFGEPMSSGF